MTPAQQKILDDAKARRAAADVPVGHFRGLRDAFGQGISLGSIDEMTAGLDRAMGDSGDYDRSMELQKRSREKYNAANPMKAATATALGAAAPVIASYLAGGATAPVTGGMSMALPAATTARATATVLDALYGTGGVGKVAAANTIRQGIRAGAKAGIIPGALSGYFGADQDNRGIGAAEGAGGGMVFGGGLGGASVALPNALGRARNAVGDFAEYLAGPGRIRERGALNPSPNVQPPTRTRVPAPATAAEAKIMQAMQDGQITQDQAILALARAQELNVPMTIADVGGRPIQQLVRAGRTLGDPTADRVLKERAGGGAGRVINALERGIGARSTGNPAAVSDSYLQQARTNSDPYYSQLPGLPSISNADVRTQMETPAVRRIIQAEENANRDVGRTVNSLYNTDGTLTRNPTFEEVDAVKKVVGETISANRRFGSRPNDPIPAQTQTEVERAQSVVNNLLRNADLSLGGRTYARARHEFELPMRRKNAFDQGFEQFKSKGDSETLQDILTTPEAILPTDQRYLRRGQIEALRQNIQKPIDVTSDPNRVARVAGSINARAQLDAAVPNANRRARMNERLAMENEMAATSNFVRGGSNTADKLVEVAPDILGGVISAAPAGPKAMGISGIKGVGNAIVGLVGKQTRAEISGHLLNMNQRQSMDFLERLKMLQQRGELTTKTINATAAAATSTKKPWER